jgi:hypothetical protein
MGMEVRHGYPTRDSNRTQEDEAMARLILFSGILPLMPLFCDQSNPEIIRRYKTVWLVKEGLSTPALKIASLKNRITTSSCRLWSGHEPNLLGARRPYRRPTTRPPMPPTSVGGSVTVL